jgi:dipeptidyl aminopeptidase/acylaminoacyl peptidase
MKGNLGRFAPVLAVVLAAGLLALGFATGYGYHRPDQPAKAGEAPLVKGIRASPDGKLVAFTAIYGSSEYSSVILLDTTTGKWTRKDSPAGWEDTVTQWSADGQKILFEREKIPRFAADAKAGLYAAGASSTGDKPKFDDLEQLTGEKTAVPGEKVVTGFWAPPEDLVVKTRREPKTLYLSKDGDLIPLDNAAVTYGQNRAIRVGGKLELYVVRDLPGQDNALALFRVAAGKSKQLTPALRDVVWTYVSEDCRQMVVARNALESDGWDWTYYAIGPDAAKSLKVAHIPPDVIKVFWSPDGKYILGTGEHGIWLVSLPKLEAKQLGSQSDWLVDDACWLGKTGKVVVAVKGELWQLDVATGTSTKLWRFPDEFWGTIPDSP